MRHRLTSIDNMLRGVLFGGLLAAVAAVIALVLANTDTVPLLTVRAGDPGYTPTASDTAVLPPPVRTDIPAGMLSVPVETGQALATMQAAFGPYASQTAFIIPAATVPQPNVPSTQTLP
ncbi:MAG TPA: hypothetical protein VEX13_18255 [Chloroflexia bacterium]|nr:hypothetical protein [Chloroflexia bacterium]